jgi:hypothetical protein
VAFGKTVVSYELWKSSYGKSVVGKAKGRLVGVAVKL